MMMQSKFASVYFVCGGGGGVGMGVFMIYFHVDVNFLTLFYLKATSDRN